MKNATLLDLLIADLPPAFVKSLEEGMRNIYKEALAKATKDPAWGEAGARHMYGQFRHVLTNELLLNLATEYGLKADRPETETQSTDYAHAVCGRFSMTIAHVATPGALPEKARYREQYSEINQHLAQQQLFAVESKPKEASIYVVLTHCESDKQGELGSLEFAFPGNGCTAWADHFAVQDVIDAQVARYQKEEDLLAQVQKPKPKLKATQEEAKKKG